MKFQREKIQSLWWELNPLIFNHDKEVSEYKGIYLSPDRLRFEEAEELGILRVYTARTDRLVGYAFFYVQFSMHYATSLQAIQNVFYVIPEERKSGIGQALIEFSEHELRKEKVELILHHVRTSHPELGKLLEKLGYYRSEYIYAKEIKWAAS